MRTDKLLSTPDGAVWADAFVRVNGGDADLMRAWFANAIETGRTAGYSTAKKERNPAWPGEYLTRDEAVNQIAGLLSTIDFQPSIFHPEYMRSPWAEKVVEIADRVGP